MEFYSTFVVNSINGGKGDICPLSTPSNAKRENAIGLHLKCCRYRKNMRLRKSSIIATLKYRFSRISQKENKKVHLELMKCSWIHFLWVLNWIFVCVCILERDNYISWTICYFLLLFFSPPFLSNSLVLFQNHVLQVKFKSVCVREKIYYFYWFYFSTFFLKKRIIQRIFSFA